MVSRGEVGVVYRARGCGLQVEGVAKWVFVPGLFCRKTPPLPQLTF